MADIQAYFRFATERIREYGTPPELALSHVEVDGTKWPTVNIYIPQPGQIAIECIDEDNDLMKRILFDRQTGEVLAPSWAGNMSVFEQDDSDPDDPIDLEGEDD